MICLIFTYMIKTIASDGFKTNIDFEDNNYPYKFNDFYEYDKLNTYPVFDKQGKFIGNTTARTQMIQYYLFECGDQCDNEFLGYNDGNKSRSGMLGSIKQSSPWLTTFFN